MKRVSLSILLLALSFPFTGASWIQVSEMPELNEENLIYGRVIKEIRIEGNRHTRESTIHRAMISKVGDIYTPKKAQQDRRWLKQLGIFTFLVFETIEDSDGIILLVKVEEVNPYIPAPSFKITEENGLEIGFALSSANLLGYAARLSSWLRVGGATNVGIRFKDPMLPERSFRNGYMLDYFHMERFNKLYDFNESSDDFTARFMYGATHQFRLGPRISFLSVRSDRSDVTLNSENRDNIPGFGLSFELNTLNMPVYPTQGWWSEILLMGHLGDADYWQGNLDIRRYFQLGSPKNSIALYSLTTLTSGEVGTDIPIYMQFNIGGANTMRGWDLGAREGKNQFLNTIEYWHMLVRMKRYKIWFLQQALGLQGALLLDAGTAWTTAEGFSRSWIVGGGVGVRVVAASGLMLRFDLAVGQPGLGVGIFIGSQEKAIVQRDRVR